MTDIQTWLDEGQTLDDQAADGPWLYYDDDILGPQELQKDGIHSFAECHAMLVSDAAGPFIADARTRLPQALAAIQAVLDLHKLEYVKPCRRVRAKGYPFPPFEGYICIHCSDLTMPHMVGWPCDTMKALTAQIGGLS